MKSTTQQSAHIASAPNGPAYVFTGAVDGEWTNLNNWEDANGNSPASALPDSSSTVIITGLVDTIPDSITAEVDTLTINVGAEIRITISAASATVRGVIGSFDGVGGCGNGELVMTGEAKAELRGDGENHGGSIVGDVECFDNSKQSGEVVGDVYLYNNSSMINLGELDAPECENLYMYNNSTAANCWVHYGLGMWNFSHINGDMNVSFPSEVNADGGTVVLRDDSYLQGSGILSNAGQIDLRDRSYIGANYTVIPEILPRGLVSLHGHSHNDGTINGDASFYDFSSQLGTVTGTIVCNTAGTCVP